MPGVLITLRNALLAVLFFIFAGNAFAWGDVKAGSVITFGRYPQTASGDVLPIVWRVLEVKDGKAFLLSEKGLDAVPFHAGKEGAAWKDSSIRQWLNTDFLNAAFDDSEKTSILVTVLKNPDNPLHGTPGGGDTEDRIFLLSLDEAARYFSDDAERTLFPTPYAVKRGALARQKMSGSAFWWLRTPGRNHGFASCVRSGGMMIPMGCLVNIGRSAVRPALWIGL